MTEQEWLDSKDAMTLLREVTLLSPHRSVPVRFNLNRKLRLFGCAVCRQVWDLLTYLVPCPSCRGSEDEQQEGILPLLMHGLRSVQSFGGCPTCRGSDLADISQFVVEEAERFADRVVFKRFTLADLLSENHLITTDIGEFAVWYVSRCIPVPMFVSFPPGWPSLATQAVILRGIVGNPFRKIDPADVVSWCSMLPVGVVELAREAYDTHNWTMLPALADALEDVGCTHKAIIDHLRGKCASCVWSGFDDSNPQQGLAEVVHECPAPIFARGDWALDMILGKE